MEVKSVCATWFETKIKYDKMQENGLLKNVKETYVVDALSFSEAEVRIIKEMTNFVAGELVVDEIKRANYREVVFPDAAGDYWYKCKVQLITIDEKTEKEKKTNLFYLVNAESLDMAKKAIDEMFSKTVMDYRIASVTETAVIEVFEHDLNADVED